MKHFRHTNKNNTACHKLPSIAKITIGLFIAGLAVGIFTGCLFEGRLYAPLLNTYSELSGTLQDYQIDKQVIFLMAAKRNMKILFLFLLFCITNLWCYYLSAYTLYTGFTNGLLLAFCVLFHHANGIARYLIYQLPQALLFLPLYLIIICRCHQLHRDFTAPPSVDFLMFSDRSTLGNASKKGKLLLCQLPFVVACILFLLLGCLLEAYGNIPLLTWYSSHGA